MFKKKNCISVRERLLRELTEDEIDDEKRLAEVLVTFSEVVSQAPEAEVSMINEDLISDFYYKCKTRGRLGFYAEFIAYYCQHTAGSYEKFARMYLENVLTLMNDPSEGLVDKVIKAFTAIVGGLQKESQFALVPLIKHCIEDVGVTQVQVGDHHTLYKKKVATIRMLEKAEGVK